MLHLGAGRWLAPEPAEYLPRQSKPAVLTVVLATKDEFDSGPVAAEMPNPSSHATAGGAPRVEAEGKLTQKAQLLVAPDLAALEEIAVPFSGSITLRLLVNSRGTVDSVTVVKSDPIPKHLLDGLLMSFGQARFSPALAGSQPMVSTRDLVIRYEAAPTPLPHAR